MDHLDLRGYPLGGAQCDDASRHAEFSYWSDGPWQPRRLCKRCLAGLARLLGECKALLDEDARD